MEKWIPLKKRKCIIEIGAGYECNCEERTIGQLLEDDWDLKKVINEDIGLRFNSRDTALVTLHKVI